MRQLLKRKKTVVVYSILSFVFLASIGDSSKADIKDMAMDVLSYIPKLIADGMNTVLGTMNMSIDKLVFNTGVGADGGYTLLKTNGLSKQIYTMYGIMQIIAVSIMAFLGLWIALDFFKTDNDQKKAELKGRLLRLLGSVLLISFLPYIVDLLFEVNAVLVDVFKSITDSLFKSGVKASNITETFSALFSSDAAEGGTKMVYAILYLTAVFINIWLIIFYIIRDLAISFLFILSPILFSLFIYRADLVKMWFKELIGNIFTQSVQAFIFTVLMGIISGIGTDSSIYDSVFALVAFATFIPMTGQIKQMLGIEGQFGAAKSNAGIGAAVGTVMLGAAMAKGLKNKGSELNDLKHEYKEVSTAEKEYNKNISSSEMTNNFRNPTNNSSNGFSNNGNSTPIFSSNAEEQIQSEDVNGNFGGNNTRGSKNNNINNSNLNTNFKGEKARIRRQAFGKALGGVNGAVGGMSMALGSSVYGNAFASYQASQVGGMVGKLTGKVSEKSYELGQDVNERTQDAVFGVGEERGINGIKNINNEITQGIEAVDVNDPDYIEKSMSNIGKMKENFKEYLNKRSVREDSNLGIDKDVFNNTDEYNRERKARISRNRGYSIGSYKKANSSYANKTYNRINNDGLNNLSEDLNGNDVKTVENLNNNKPMIYRDRENEILFRKSPKGNEILYVGKGDPTLKQPTIENVSIDNSNEINIPQDIRNDISEEVINKGFAKYGAEFNVEENSVHKNFYNKEVENRLNNEISRIQNLRSRTGINNITTGGNREKYIPVNRENKNQNEVRTEVNSTLAAYKNALKNMESKLEDRFDYNEGVNQI